MITKHALHLCECPGAADAAMTACLGGPPAHRLLRLGTNASVVMLPALPLRELAHVNLHQGRIASKWVP